MKTIRYIVPILIFAAMGCISTPDRDDNAAVMCMGNLMRLTVEEEVWCRREHKGPNDVPTKADLAKLGFPVLSCPSKGIYKLGPVCKGPTCSIKGHELPKPIAN